MKCQIFFFNVSVTVHVQGIKDESCCMRTFLDTHMLMKMLVILLTRLKRQFSKVYCAFSENRSATFDTVGRLIYSHDMQILH